MTSLTVSAVADASTFFAADLTVSLTVSVILSADVLFDFFLLMIASSLNDENSCCQFSINSLLL